MAWLIVRTNEYRSNTILVLLQRAILAHPLSEGRPEGVVAAGPHILNLSEMINTDEATS